MGVPAACMGKNGSGGSKPPPYGLSCRLKRHDKLKFVYSRIGYELSVGVACRELTFFFGFSIIYYHIIGEEFL